MTYRVFWLRAIFHRAAAFLLAGCILIGLSCEQVARGTKPIQSAPRVNQHQDGIVVQLAHGGDRLFAKVHVNDQDVGWWLLDTGEPGIVIDASVAKRLNLPVVSKMWGADRDDPDASLVLLGKLQVASMPALCHLAISTDLSQWRSPVDVQISGILGWAFLRDRPFSIDFRAGTLTLFAPGAPLVPGKPTYTGRIRFPAGVPEVEGNIGGLYSGWFRIDSGEEFPLVLDPCFMAAHPEIAARPPPVGDLPEYENAQNGRFGSLNLLGKSQSVAATLWTNASPKLPPRQWLLSIAHVGAPFLRGTRLAFDPATRHIWAEQLATEPLDALLSRLGDCRTGDLVGVTPLMRAAREARYDAVAALIERGADVNAVDARGRTPLMWGCEGGSVEAVRSLLGHGANPNAGQKSGHTALDYAAVRGDTHCVMALLAAHADVRGPSGSMPLMWAAAADRDKVAELLIRAGVQPQAGGSNENSPLSVASELGNVATLRVLLKDGKALADPLTGRTLVMEAVARDRIETVRELIRDGVDVNARAADGKTALMEAADRGAIDCVRVLLAAGADPTLRSAEGKNALDYAIGSKRQFCMLLLYAVTHRTTPVAPDASTRPSRVVIPAQRGGPFLCLPASIDGQPPVPMILDTGAIGLFIGKSMVEKLHLKKLGAASAGDGSEKTAPADIVEVPRLEIGGFSFGPTLAFAVDLSGIRKSFGSKVPFIVGMPFIDSAIKIDFPAAKVEVWDNAAFPPPDGTAEIPLQTFNSSLCVPGVLFGHDHIMAQIDTGAGYDPVDIALLGSYPLLHLLELGPKLDWQLMQSIAGVADAEIYKLNGIEMLGRHFEGAITSVFSALPTNGWSTPPSVVTATMLSKCTLWLDPAGGRAWARWVPDDEPLDAFLRRTGADSAADLLHTTPLMRAVRERRADAVAALLTRGANPNDADTTNTTALTMACTRGDQRIADLLLDHGAKGTVDALVAAASRGLPEVLGRIVQAGNWKRAKPADLLGPLRWAAWGNNAACVERILDTGADPDGKNPEGSTVLISCGLWGSSNAAKVLLRHKANLEAALPNGQRALMLAAQGNHGRAVSVFLAHGAIVDAVDHDGRTALMYAAPNPDIGVVPLLLKSGAKPGLSNRNGATALEIAAEARIFSNAEAIYFALVGAR